MRIYHQKSLYRAKYPVMNNTKSELPPETRIPHKRHATPLETLPVTCQEVEAVPGHVTSLLPDGFDFRLVWNNEFDGYTLDNTNWEYRNNHMTGDGVPELEAATAAGDAFEVDFVRVFNVV